MAFEAPKRRFAPTPVETSVKSNRPTRQGDAFASKASTPRRFAVEPVETTVRKGATSGGRSQANPTESAASTSSGAPRKFTPQPVETTTRHHNAAETSSKGSRPTDQPSKDNKPPRKFAVQPVEETQKSSKDKPDKPKSRFAPQPVESSSRRRRSGDSHVPRRRDSELDETPADIPIIQVAKHHTRKFAVELIDTSARSRKNSDEVSPVPHKFRTDVVPGHMVTESGEALFPSARWTKRTPLPHERRKERTGCSNARSHSFLAPDLETIESSESDMSDAGSPLQSKASSAADGSPITTSEGSSESYKARQTKAADTDDERFSEFMSGLEAQRAEQALREQVLAAFPNSDYHEPVEHYVNDDDNDSDDLVLEDRPTTWEGHEDEDEEEFETPKTWRQATSRIDWEMEDMKKHHDQLEKARAAAVLAQSKKTDPSPWWNANASRALGANGVDPETMAMRDRARPPMLGSDLVFPRSKSPEPARFDITQGSDALKSQMCYLSEQADVRNRENKTTASGLWGGAPSPIKADSMGKGLWAGFCAAGSRQNTDEFEKDQLPSGLVTPAVVERTDPFDPNLNQKVASCLLQTPPTPTHGRSRTKERGVVPPAIDSVLNDDAELDQLMRTEYDDSFITQVFNYLSLGYPSLARPFDEELSKISGIPIKELREDDQLAIRAPKGYIRVGDDFEGRGDGSDQGLDRNRCKRWLALRLYVREWARQEKGMVHVQAVPWGTAPRRGSWAW